MTEEAYINIFNTSLDSFLNAVSDNYDLDKEELDETYKYNNMKKVSGYMLFVKDFYKFQHRDYHITNQKFVNDSKIISEKWKVMTSIEKEKYNKIAREINSKNKKEKDKKKKKKSIDEKTNYVDNYNDKLDNRSMVEIQHDGKTYYKDCFDNIINENGEYVLLN